MSSLNPDILEEIVSHFNIWAMENEKESVEAIKKFMLSGNEPYQAALQYFSSVDSVSIDSFSLRLQIKRFVVRKRFNNDSNLYIFPFDFSFLDDILKAVIKTNTNLQIESYPFSNSGRRILTMLLNKDLKFISLDSARILPSDFYEFFKNECKFDDARLTLCCTKRPFPDEFFELTSTHRSVTTHFENFVLKMPEEGIFPAVESLSFDPCFCEQDFNESDFTFKTETVFDFLTFISKSMPNLKKLYAIFVANPKRQYYTWEEIFNEMTRFRSNSFEHVSSQINGLLSFCVHDHQKCFRYASEEIDKNAEINIVHEKKQFIKKFNIHDGLSFEIILQFSDVDSEWDDEDSFDEYEIGEEDVEDFSVSDY